jgi:hypothetical protein
MTKTFTPRLYVFGKEHNPKLADFFGKDKLKVIDLTTIDRLNNTTSNAVFQVADYFFTNCNTLTIVEDFKEEVLSFFCISGAATKVFRVDSTDDENDFITLSQMVGNATELTGNYQNFAYSMQSLIEDGQSVFESTDSNEMSESFEEIQAFFSYFEDLLHDCMKFKVRSLELKVH